MTLIFMWQKMRYSVLSSYRNHWPTSGSNPESYTERQTCSSFSISLVGSWLQRPYWNSLFSMKIANLGHEIVRCKIKLGWYSISIPNVKALFLPYPISDIYSFPKLFSGSIDQTSKDVICSIRNLSASLGCVGGLCRRMVIRVRLFNPEDVERLGRQVSSLIWSGNLWLIFLLN